MKRFVGVFVLIGALALTGCGSDKSSSSSAAAAGSDSTATTAAGTAGSSSNQNKTVIKSVSFTSSSATHVYDYKIDIQGLHRRGPFLELDGAITCTKSDIKTCDGEFVLAGNSSQYNTPGGITLIDPANKKEYLVVADTSKEPYTSKLDPSFPLNTETAFFVNFPAPPTDVKTMNIVLPAVGAPQITDVTIS